MTAPPVRPPAVSRVIEEAAARGMVALHGHAPVVAAVRAAIEEARRGGGPFDPALLAERAALRLAEEERSPLRPVWNLTGTILHTNLGRALLSERACAAALAAMARPVALEYDLASGGRGERDSALDGLLRELTGAEASLAVNNNAAAVMLVLAGLAAGREVIVSRGELIEIGGAFRLPDIMAAAGAVLVEVGTTNRTRLGDYEAAIGPATALILKVHPSNFRIEGFTAEVPAADLALLARKHAIALVNDLGSGTLEDIAAFGLPREPTVAQAVAEGADLVTFSGDKLLGGPQAGLVVGKGPWVERLKRHPMKRAMRLDKIRLAALEATLRDARAGRLSPTRWALARPLADIAAAAQRIGAALEPLLPEGHRLTLRDGASQVGSGAAPTATLPSLVVAIEGPATGGLARALRALPEPVIGRIADGALLLDPRVVREGEEAALIANLRRLAEARG